MGNEFRGIISPETLEISINQKVRWTNSNVRDHLVSCKVEFGRQVFKGERITPGEYSEYTFTESGKYICLDAIYGARQTVIVK